MNKNLMLLFASVFLVLIFPSILIFHSSQPLDDEIKNQESISADENKAQTVKVLTDSENIRSMDLDDYLVAVVLCEMPVKFSEEALKAQAIVARTYTLRRIEKSTKHENCDVCTDASCCQGFKSKEDYIKSGGKESDINKVIKAVNDTNSLVLMYKGALIDATYFSCSGGMTEDAVAVWGKDVPYLKATDSPGEEIATHYTDAVSYRADELSQLLALSTEKSPGAWVESITYTAGGGVDEIVICGKIFTGVALRKLLNLRSTAFSVDYKEGVFVIETKGYGHRVGMSQYGAEAMALSGATCEQILLHYYTGVELVEYQSSD